MSAPVDRLVNDDRFSGDNVSLFLLYLPLGLVLTCVRLLIGVVLWTASLLLPDKASSSRLLSTVACATFGMHVKLRGTRDRRSSLIVANHVSALDPLAVYYMFGTLSLRKWRLPPFFAAALGIKSTANFSPDEAKCRPLLLQPEGIPTSGAGLLRFSAWPLNVPDSVQPLAIRVERMFTKVTVHSALDKADSIPWSDLLWYLWTPATTYYIHLLPSLERASGEGDAAFVERIRERIAAELEIEATEYGVSDVIDCARRGVRRSPAPPSGGGPRPDLQRLAQQVKEVLPRVPTTDILKDLARTRSVDITITNFLEEITPYTPEPSPPDSRPSTSRDAVPPPPATFPADPKTRQLSFQERKAQMIAEARRKYIEKHGLKSDC